MFYNKIFTPLSFKIVTNEKNMNNKIIVKKGTLDIDILLNNCADIYIQRLGDELNVYIVFSGYFVNDSLNIITRTSQICNHSIFAKKKDIESYITGKGQSRFNEKFMRSYIRNSSISDILMLSKNDFLNKLKDEYKQYNKLTKLSFMYLMKEFVRDDKNDKLNIRHMYLIIKLLLLGSDEDINIAGLLCGISKEKRPGYDCSISEIIYRNLNYASQIKLRKTSMNIKNELDRIKILTIDDVDLKKQVVVCKNMPDAAKKAALEKVEEMKSSNNEYYKQLLYVKTLLNFPWPSDDENSFFTELGSSDDRSKDFLDGVVQKIDNRVYGHKMCKNHIKQLIGKWISNPSSSGSAIGLVGPPGVGKTLIAKAIGEALDISFVQITLGGQNDGEILHGHGYTYSGAQPGMVIKKMCESGSSRCIMYFDELDKACKKHDNNEIYNILIHLIDPNINNEFQDRFFQEITFPLNKVLFIFSYNDSSVIDKILLNRITEIDVKPYKRKDKVNIGNKFLVKEMSDMVSFEENSVTFENKNLEFIIDKYTHEAGVRDLKRKLEKIFLGMNIDKIYKKGLFEKIEYFGTKYPVNINDDIITNYLGKHLIDLEKIHIESLVGVVNGLYATESGGGGILPIQVFINYTGDDEKFTLRLTGNQRKVMRESVISAFTTALHSVNCYVRTNFVKTYSHGFHVHLPGCAIPKDGPSAGSAFTTAFVSRILNKPIKNDIAMTGEIELTGKITKIGKLQYKLIGAKRAGIKLVMIPKENEDDLKTIEEEYGEIFTDNFRVKMVDNITQVLEEALIDFDKTELAD
jgi:endopeptidase La